MQEISSQDRNQCYVIGDWARLQQVLRNILSNAIKFSQVPSGSVVVKAYWDPSSSRHNYDNEGPTLSTTDGDIKNCELKDGTVVQLLCSGSIVVNVEDTGAGMTPEQLSNLFTAGMKFNANELQVGQGSGLVVAVIVLASS